MLIILNIMSITAHISDTTTHHERVAWLTLAAMSVTFGPYLVWMAISPPVEPLPDWKTMRLFGGAAAIQMVILAVGHLWLRMKWPEDANAPADERDRAIALRSLRVAYYVLIAGMILVGCVMPFNSGGWKLVNAAIAVIVLAQGVHYGMVVRSYRRG